MFIADNGKVRGPVVAAAVTTPCVLLVLLFSPVSLAGPLAILPAEPDSIQRSILQLERLVPKTSAEYVGVRMEELLRAVAAVDQAAAELGRTGRPDDRVQIHGRIDRLSSAKEAVDKLLENVLNQRVEFASPEPSASHRGSIRNYLQLASKLIDLSGRLQYEIADAIGDAAFRFAGQPALRDELIDQVIVLRSGIGASIMSWALLDPPADSPNRAQPASPATKVKLLAMIAWSGRIDALPVVVQFLKGGRVTSELTICAAETIRQLGLPQDPRPGGDPKLPPPAITAAELQRVVANLDTRSLNRDLSLRRAELLRWLEQRRKHGVESDGYQVGRYLIQPGDWLLMRNSSPYNLFTDLAPGLFTHVSVVTIERDANGFQRMVVVEVTERANRIPANNLESVLDVPLYYAFLRHDDPAVARKMSDVAAALIGNELEYDMSFETARVTELQGKPLAGLKIKAYCAGLPLLCAQETSLPREEFFPIPEYPAGGRAVANLNKLGVRFGNDFVSPTGSLFSQRMRIVARSEHIYAPGREIEQAIYDHAAACIIDKELMPTPNLFQSLRLKLADASKGNPVLARALAAAAGVSADTDLVTAAKTLAVLETLFEIATGNSNQLLDALDAVYGGSPEDLATIGRKPDEIDRITKLRARHADLRQRAEQGQLSPRQVRDALVGYYIEQGKHQIDQRFFAAESAQP